LESYPATILEFRDWFATEQACQDYIAGLRWPNGFACPQCHHKGVDHEARTFLVLAVRPSNVSHGGTLFHDTHKPLRLWFEPEQNEGACRRV